ncbi:MAG: DUF2911 domain-containing protein [Saprospiraceae bacterium]|nr:DUF2911 domain-containing protein [Saprospiraceae bacterium]MBK9221883.1 DUF2911 domain-containing protein [Saprospiraceae bacterium]MBK9728176.1 DUF2911 domain-containing protein [Saprospiraceae bacterium]
MAQIPLTTLPSGGNKRASVSEWVGLTEVKIDYSRPGVKGREGKIWGELIPYGMTDPGFGNSKAAPWRAGANENTTISFSKDVKIEGNELPAGKYGFFILFDSLYSTLIFSKNAESWGHFFYTEKEDILRIKIKPQKQETNTEWLEYKFINQKEDAATIAISWEKLQFTFNVQSNYLLDQIQVFRNELRTERGFLWESWNQAAQWCVQKNINLDEALQWADTATSTIFGGDKSFQAYITKSQVLQKLNRIEESTEIMKRALPKGNMFEIHQYGKQLISMKLPIDAMEIFKYNFEKYPNTFTTLVGMTRGNAAMGDYDKALKFALKALPLAPDSANKINLESMIKKLTEKKDIN